jgi:hypothetical protein
MATGRKTGGRRRGTPNKATEAKRTEILASGMSALDFMVSVFRDETQPLAVRLDAARSVAPYCHPRLSTLDIGSRDDKPLVVQVLRFSDVVAEDKQIAQAAGPIIDADTGTVLSR